MAIPIGAGLLALYGFGSIPILANLTLNGKTSDIAMLLAKILS